MDLLKFETIKLPTLVALNETEQNKGLMGVAWPPPIMTFYYSNPKCPKFWMKNTPSPLNLLFCLDNKVSHILEGIPNSLEIIKINSLSNMVIEMPAGLPKILNIKEGSSVNLEMSLITTARLFEQRLIVRGGA